MKWAYGLTTCAERVKSGLASATLRSLAAGGFTGPRVFADGCDDPLYLQHALEVTDVTVRFPTVGGYGNWILALGELYVRTPNADRYVLFQDDLVCMRNLKPYLDRVKMPADGYLNLYTFPQIWREANPQQKAGFFRAKDGKGKGALALVFDRRTATKLFQSPVVVEKPNTAFKPTRNIDGCVVTALNRLGVYEHCHYPSLVQHTGEVSSLGSPKHPPADTFPGEEHDAMGFYHAAHLEHSGQKVL